MSSHISALLIDDDTRLGRLLQEYLGQHEIDLTIAADGGRGLAALSAQHFDVVLLDLMLPGIDGLEVCRRIRSAPDVAAVPVLMLTAKGDDRRPRDRVPRHAARRDRPCNPPQLTRGRGSWSARAAV